MIYSKQLLDYRIVGINFLFTATQFSERGGFPGEGSGYFILE
jgi:hypothetical protein